MDILIVGASGATGRLLLEQLLQRGHNVRAVVRSPEKLPEHLKEHSRLSVIKASILDLSDEEKVSEYEVYSSPIRSAIFDPGKTSRINVAHFMADLITDDDIWNSWNGQMPVIYNKAKQD